MRGQFRDRVNYYFVILFGESRNTGKLVIVGKLISSSESCCERQNPVRTKTTILAFGFDHGKNEVGVVSP